MTVGIPPEFVCPQGHRWRLDDHPADRSDDERPRCLICGGDALPADRPIGEGGGEGPSGQPPRHSSNPPPGRPRSPRSLGTRSSVSWDAVGQAWSYEARELAWDRRVTLEVEAESGIGPILRSGKRESGKRDRSDIVKLGGPADVRAIFNRARHFDFDRRALESDGEPWGPASLGVRPI